MDEKNRNGLKSELVVDVENEYKWARTREYKVFPGYLGSLKITAWKFAKQSSDRIPEILKKKEVDLRYNVKYFGEGEYNGDSYEIFEGFNCSLASLDENTLSTMKMVEVDGNRGCGLGENLKLIINSVSAAVKELKYHSLSHGNICLKNVVLMMDANSKITSVKLVGVTGTSEFRKSWEKDYRAIGEIVKHFLEPYTNYPEALDYIQRFRATGRFLTPMEKAFLVDPTSINRHPIWWDANTCLGFICKLSNWSSAYDEKKYLKPPLNSVSDDNVQNAVLGVNSVSWGRDIIPNLDSDMLKGYDFDCNQNFLRFARNNFQHSANQKQNFQEWFGVTHEEYYRKFRNINAHFLIESYLAVENNFTGPGGIVDSKFFNQYLILPRG